MNYENLDDQGKNAQDALSFLPKSMVDSITKPEDPDLGRRKKDIVRLKTKEISDAKILPKDLNYGLGLDIEAGVSREQEEKKNVMLASGIGTLSLVLLIYILWLR